MVSRVHSLDRLEEVIVINENGCWIWQGCLDRDGYGQVGIPGTRKITSAHIAVYEKYKGPVPKGKELDHICRTRPCVNYDHVEPVTHKENMRRVPYSAIQYQKNKTHCPKGHSYSDAYINSNGSRECRECREEKDYD